MQIPYYEVLASSSFSVLKCIHKGLIIVSCIQKQALYPHFPSPLRVAYVRNVETIYLHLSDGSVAISNFLLLDIEAGSILVKRFFFDT